MPSKEEQTGESVYQVLARCYPQLHTVQKKLTGNPVRPESESECPQCYNNLQNLGALILPERLNESKCLKLCKDPLQILPQPVVFFRCFGLPVSCHFFMKLMGRSTFRQNFPEIGTGFIETQISPVFDNPLTVREPDKEPLQYILKENRPFVSSESPFATIARRHQIENIIAFFA